MALILKLDIDMVKIYMYTKMNLLALADQITYPHTRMVNVSNVFAVKKVLAGWKNVVPHCSRFYFAPQISSCKTLERHLCGIFHSAIAVINFLIVHCEYDKHDGFYWYITKGC